MIKWLYRLRNHDEIDRLNSTIESYRERIGQLEAEVREYKGYKLKYEVTKLYVDDDEALCELLDAAKLKERSQDLLGQSQMSNMARASALQNLYGQSAHGLYGPSLSQDPHLPFLKGL